MYTTIGGKGRCHTRGESEESVACRRGSTQARESTLALKPRADVTGSPKQGHQWPHKKDLCPTKILKKRKKLASKFIFKSNGKKIIAGQKISFILKVSLLSLGYACDKLCGTNGLLCNALYQSRSKIL